MALPLSVSLSINGAGLLSAAWPENGLQGGLVLGATVVPILSVVILALALNGLGFIPMLM